MDQLNRLHRIKLEFEVTAPLNKPEDGDKNTLWSVQDGLDPETAVPGKKRLRLSRDQFFQTVVAIINGRSFTVRDVIQFEANVAGAVHAGAPRTEKEKALQSIGQSISVGGYAPALRQLLAIARVALRALQPVRAASHAA